jgi:hypothetical protein
MEHTQEPLVTDGAPHGLMAPEGTSRRAFLRRMAALGLMAGVAPQVIACGGGDSGGDAGSGAGDTGADAGGAASDLNCDDPATLNDVDVSTRTALGYVETSTTDGQHCTNCMQFEPAEGGGCGTCKVVPGTINPNGWCSVWVELT